ncbi:MAG: hypothetical protein ACK5PP_12670 [Acidimicrobiales bacterium]
MLGRRDLLDEGAEPLVLSARRERVELEDEAPIAWLDRRKPWPFVDRVIEYNCGFDLVTVHCWILARGRHERGSTHFGPLTLVEPVKVIAWRMDGWAGRDGFQATGRWTFPPDPR